jgi:hypothetical protein
MPLASLLKQYSFESDTTRLLTTAFDQTWAKVVASHSPLANEETRTQLACCWPNG